MVQRTYGEGRKVARDVLCGTHVSMVGEHYCKTARRQGDLPPADSPKQLIELENLLMSSLVGLPTNCSYRQCVVRKLAVNLKVRPEHAAHRFKDCPQDPHSRTESVPCRPLVGIRR